MVSLPFLSSAVQKRDFQKWQIFYWEAKKPTTVKLKAKFFDDSHLGVLQRVDCLVHKVTTELHSSYWLDRFADESDSFQNVKEGYIASTSWHQALEIPDSAVTLDDKNRLFAKVVRKKDSSLTHIVWNRGSEFSFCDRFLVIAW